MPENSWAAVARETPELAEFVRQRFEKHGLGLIATIRADGSPRISGIEPQFTDTDLILEMMPASQKLRDLHRDGRFSLHNATIDKDVAEGDVKISGIAHAVGGNGNKFQVELTSMTSIRVAVDRLLITVWKPGKGTKVIERL